MSNDFEPLAGTADSSLPGPGVSLLATELSGSRGTLPNQRLGTFGTPPMQTPSPAAGSSVPPTTPASYYGSFDARLRSGPAWTGFEDPEIVRRHLVQPSQSDQNYNQEAGSAPGSWSGGADGTRSRWNDGATLGISDDEFSSLRLQGGDVTRPIYRWTEEQGRARRYRSQSFHVSRPEPENEILDIGSIKVPGGFRRNFLRRVAGDSSPEEDLEGASSNEHGTKHPRLLTHNFIEFLSIYGHFAGEELEEDDEALGPDEYFGSDDWSDHAAGEGSDDDHEPMEDSALLTPGRRRRKRKEVQVKANNGEFNAALLLLKSFVGTGVLFLPKAYLNGGMLFSNLVLLFVAALSYYCFVLLVSTSLKIPGSFGDMGGRLYGRWMRNTILFSIVISQIGFVAAYIVFTAENLQAFIHAVSKCKTFIPIPYLILMQMVIFLPFSLLRDISKLGFTALIADAFILVGLIYLYYYDILTLVQRGGIADIVSFNPVDWTLFIGTAIFTFEGIGLIIPIQESMRAPQKFPRVLAIVMVIITVIFISMGALSYAAYGSKTETVVLLNLPQDSQMVNGVQFLYSMAILLSTPLQIFPAIRITETELFTRSGKYNPNIKWQKNGFRFLVVALCAAIAWGGAADLDKFVSLVGTFACVPLVYIYPPMLHYRAVAKSRLMKIADVLLGIFGAVAMVYTTSQTIANWASGDGTPIPKYCDGKNGAVQIGRF